MFRVIALLAPLILLSACVNTRAPFILVESDEQSVKQVASGATEHLLKQIQEERVWHKKIFSTRVSIVPTKTARSHKNIHFAPLVSKAIETKINQHPRIHLVKKRDLRRPVNYVVHSRVSGTAQGKNEKIFLKIWAEDKKTKRIVAAIKSPIHLNTCKKIQKPRAEADSKNQALNQAATASAKHLLKNMAEERGCLGKLLPTRVQVEPTRHKTKQTIMPFASQITRQINHTVNRQTGFKASGNSTHSPAHYTVKSTIDGKQHQGNESIIMQMWAEEQETKRVLAAATTVINHEVCVRIHKPQTFNNNRAQPFQLAARKDVRLLLRSMANERGCMTELFSTLVEIDQTRAANTQQSILFSKQLRQAVNGEINSYPRFEVAANRVPNYRINSNVTGKEVAGREVFTLHIWAEDRKTGRLLAKTNSILQVKSGLARPKVINTRVSSLANLNQQLLKAVEKDRSWRSQVATTRIAVAPAFDAITQERLDMGNTLTDSMKQIAGNRQRFQIIPLTTENLDKAHYITYHAITLDKQLGNHVRLQTWLRERKSGRLLAEAQSIISTTQLPYKLSKEAEDSPVYPVAPKRGVHFNLKQQLAGTRTPRLFQKDMQALALLTEAGQAYKEGNYQQALEKYRLAAKLPAGQKNSRALAGTYVSLLRLGKTAEAQEIFGELIKTGFLKADTLTFKILFAVNSVDFFGGNFLSKQYNDWVKQIGSYLTDNNRCIKITGHSSNSGSATYNLDLSGRRSANIEKLMQRANPGTTGRITTDGKGFSENIVGTGSDDIRDAVDRRVEFQQVGC